ncbi:MauE/DoxX family redox-associated membrane protein [Permianibacter aggregans]|uniref:Methylamine utilization protein MauE n=1 Tax=Permianibacter aggregans TaxID=1510150 RepID=A0A4V3D6Y1_9GAMM|nr:MauE/DoxX family redox-associated membrane protein [Permianibacter aggregans]QGX41634.1 hypothetical protein E2H98_19000 [Permianibacter aggregans]TDQ45707.1 methylamine utilization protein MauE [Permianibacter aggregans]
MSEKPSFHQQDDQRGKALRDYWPLTILVLVSISAGFALAWQQDFSVRQIMHGSMGFFLCVFALLKLFHPQAFAGGFSMYDLLAKRWRPYAYVYPFIELLLGLAYLAHWQRHLVYSATIIIMVFGAVGVVYALTRDLDINCPCMGSILDVPLSTVTLTENLGMALMASVMLLATV